jgi:hypothetical protein
MLRQAETCRNEDRGTADLAVRCGVSPVSCVESSGEANQYNTPHRLFKFGILTTWLQSPLSFLKAPTRPTRPLTS